LDFEVEVIPGLEEFTEDELRRRLGPGLRVTGRPGEGRIAFGLRGYAGRLDGLRSVVAVYRRQRFDVPRPKALLGHANLQMLLGLLRETIDARPPGAFQTLRLSAAGADSPVFRRLKDELATGLGLRAIDGPADLLLVIRRPPDGAPGWEALVRTSPRPLSARAWRVCDLPGALNATVAYAMATLAEPRPAERYVNLLCGSGTLLVERLGLGPVRQAIGIDDDAGALGCARENLRAAGLSDAVGLVRADATRLPLPDGCADTLVADLPYGMLMGRPVENARLYPALLAEAARVAAPAARFVAITAQRRLFDQALATHAASWRLARTIPLTISHRGGYIHPAIYVLERIVG
jgi:tRNA (guanine6-N2)-methyltransferase